MCSVSASRGGRTLQVWSPLGVPSCLTGSPPLVKIKERANLELFFQAFDLTNHANFGSSYNSNVRASTFGTPLGFITPGGTTLPRSFSGEFGAQFRF